MRRRIVNKVYEVRMEREDDDAVRVEFYRDCITVHMGSSPDFSTGLESVLNRLRQQGERPVSVQARQLLARFEDYVVVTEPLNGSTTDMDARTSIPQADGAHDGISTLLCFMAPDRPKRRRRTRAELGTKGRSPTNLQQAVQYEGLLGKSSLSTSAVLIARLVIRRGYAGRARRPKTRIEFAEPDGED
ncbi:MAG TPA: hypothetical protein VJ553_00360 [Candidatus Paceibacterota bacterium]|nr:hypothetical protein [Candidatus Paceibacterota bacterium]